VTVEAPRLVYGGGAYGVMPYGGYISADIIPTRNVSGIIFLTSNDRYQVVSCSYGGTFSTPPEFRYWYAGPAPWAEDLAMDGYIPPYFSEDEDGTTPTASLELPFRKFPQGQEGEVQGVTVEFIPRPSSLTEDDITAGTTVSFDVTVEAQGVRNWTDGVGASTLGMMQSSTFSFSEDGAEQGSSIWPNIRTEFFPCRLRNRCRGARAVISNIQLCEIVSVSLVGTTLPGREQ
jgi:hypothetical protein